MEQFCLQITDEMEGIRIDKCISELMGDRLSRSYLQKMIKDGELLVNGSKVKVSYPVKSDDEITFSIKDPIIPDLKAVDIALDILYEDSDLLVVNKPKGMVVHPAPGHYDDTLVNALLFHCGDELSGINGVMRPGIVHRIDRDTSGSIVVCKNDFTHRALAEQFKVHSITRKYYCICMGRINDEELVISKPIGRNPNDRLKMGINEKNGKNAVTHIKVLKRFAKTTYVECQLETGRTHQIRVHMASIGHPLLGDLVYGQQDYKGLGQILHAKELGFVHPATGQYVLFTAPLPEYFQECLRNQGPEV